MKHFAPLTRCAKSWLVKWLFPSIVTGLQPVSKHPWFIQGTTLVKHNHQSMVRLFKKILLRLISVLDKVCLGLLRISQTVWLSRRSSYYAVVSQLYRPKTVARWSTPAALRQHTLHFLSGRAPPSVYRYYDVVRGSPGPTLITTTTILYWSGIPPAPLALLIGPA